MAPGRLERIETPRPHEVRHRVVTRCANTTPGIIYLCLTPRCLGQGRGRDAEGLLWLLCNRSEKERRRSAVGGRPKEGKTKRRTAPCTGGLPTSSVAETRVPVAPARATRSETQLDNFSCDVASHPMPSFIGIGSPRGYSLDSACDALRSASPKHPPWHMGRPHRGLSALPQQGARPKQRRPAPTTHLGPQARL